MIVVLSHLGLAGDKHLAEAVDGLDIIVGGHSHNRMEQAERVGKTLIVQAGAHGSDLGRLDLTIDGARSKTTNTRSFPWSMIHFPLIRTLPAKLRKFVAPFTEALSERIGTAADWLSPRPDHRRSAGPQTRRGVACRFPVRGHSS